MDIPDRLRVLICFLACIFALSVLPGHAQAPLTNYSPHIILVGGNTLSASSVSHQTHRKGVLTSFYAKNELYHLIAQYPGWNANVAYAIMMAESRGNSKAINWRDNHRTCSGSFGLFQLACFRGTQAELLNTENNVKMAYELWKQKGWRPWGAYLNGSYLKFLH